MAFVGVNGFCTKTQQVSRTCRQVVRNQQVTTEGDFDDRLALDRFISLVAVERKEMLENTKRSILIRQEMWEEGVSEKEMLTYAGQLKNRYAKRHGMKTYDLFDVSGAPTTEIPGIPYATSVGAMDFYTGSTATLVGVKPTDSYTLPEVEERVEETASADSREELTPEASEEEEVVEEVEEAEEAEEEEEEADEADAAFALPG